MRRLAFGNDSICEQQWDDIYLMQITGQSIEYKELYIIMRILNELDRFDMNTRNHNQSQKPSLFYTRQSLVDHGQGYAGALKGTEGTQD